MVTINLTLGLSWTVLSFCFFLLCRYLARPLIFLRERPEQNPKISKPYIQTFFTHSNVEQWERLNLLISFLHSVITGLSVIYSFWAYAPEIYQDFVEHITLVTYLTCTLSYGMFTSIKKHLIFVFKDTSGMIYWIFSPTDVDQI